jgi:hypothetical protein
MNEIVRRHGRLAEAGENPRTASGIHADNDAVARFPQKRIVRPRIRAGDDAERQIEQRQQLAPPVAHQTGRGNN